MKGGTSAPVKRKTAGHQIGDTVVCISAGSTWHKVGRKTVVEAHPRTGLASVPALDGHHDELCMCTSKFEQVTE